MKYFVLALLLSFSTLLFGQENSGPEKIWSSGLPFITNFNTEDFKAAPQNWSISQGNDGLIYVGNNSGILEYDGSSWRTIKTSLGNPVRSLGKDSKGKIFVGGIGEIGFLEPDAIQGMKYHSLLSLLDKSCHDFGNVWFTYAIDDSIYFMCDNYIIRWANETFKVWSNKKYGDFGFSWCIRKNIYIDVSGKGLMKLENDSLIVVKGGEQFKGKNITGMQASGEKDMILFNIAKEILLFRNGILTSLPLSDQQKFNASVYQCIKLANGDLALGTTGSGFYLTDQDGKIKMNITKQLGLTSDVVYSIYEDAEGDLWLATDNGINHIELNSPLRLLNEKNGVDENTFDIEYFNNTIFITNSKGIFRLLKENSNEFYGKQVFTKIKGIDNLTFHCHVINDQLIISNYDGLFSLDKNNRLSLIAKDNVIKAESPSAPEQQNILFDTNSDGIGELNYSNGKWREGKQRLKIKTNAYGFARGDNGNIFINTRRNGIYEVQWQTPGQSHTLNDPYQLIHHDTTRGISLNVKSIERVGNSVFASTDKQFSKYNDLTHRFEVDTVVQSIVNKHNGSWIYEITNAGHDNYWLTLYHNYQSIVYKNENSQLRKVDAIGRFSSVLISKVFDSKSGIVFFGSNKSIFIYNENKKTDFKNIFKTSIRKVLTDQDSSIYSGFKIADQPSAPEINYSNNNLKFQFSLPSYDLSSKNQYQYFLVGFDQAWSKWNSDTQIDFTNLPEGSYSFKVRGMNVYGQISEEDEFNFSIAPPWHRTWWAYSLFVLSLIAVVFLIVKWRSRGLQREKLILENTIEERTREISQQAMQLKEMDRVKSSFFANISHEFRTPLTLILAPLEQELQNKSAADKNSLLLMKRNANRLLELVNQLLDLSKLEAGKMEMNLEQGDIGSFLNVLASSFDSWAQVKEIRFVNKIELTNTEVWFDRDKMEKIVTNLLSNAFKFTPVKGTVTFNAAIHKKEIRNVLHLSVSDTGKGIPPEEQEKVFSSFYQTKQTVEGNEGGTGLGLSLVKELVKLYGGSISLKSSADNGTEFTIEIPIDETAFKPDQLTKTHPSLYNQVQSMDEDDDNDEQLHEEITPGKDTVLIAEDNEDLRNYMRELLEKEYNVITVKDGEEAVIQASQLIPNLILSDLMMPNMDGMQLTGKIKTDQRTSHIPVILLTARSEQESKIKGLKTGADDYLTKPFSPEELRVRIGNLIQQRKRLAERFRERILVPATPSAELSLDDKFLNKARAIIETNIADTSFSVEKLAEEIFMNRTQLLRKLKALTGMSPTDFIKDLRLKRAADMIRQKTDTITQIGYAVGFNDQSYFTKCFKKQFGVTPTEYSAQHEAK